MKRLSVLLLTAVLSVLAFSAITFAQKEVTNDMVIKWETKILEDVMREELKKPIGSITPKELDHITSIYLNCDYMVLGDEDSVYYGTFGLQFENFNELKYFRNLENLNLDDMYTNDISALAELKNVKTLNLILEKVKDFSPIGDMESLEQLSITNCGLEDVSSLAALSKLEKLLTLTLQDQSFSDVTPLAELTQVKELHISGNCIKDASPLGKMVGLEKLYLAEGATSATASNNPLEGGLGFENLVDLDTLVLPYYYTLDISSLKNLPKLKEISVVFNTPDGKQYNNEAAASFFNGFEELDNVEELLLDGMQSSDDIITRIDLSQIGRMKNLKTVIYVSDDGTDISNIAQLTNIEELKIHMSYSIDYSPLEKLTNLKKLHIGNCNPNLDYLTPLKDLEELTLSGKVVNDVTPIIELTKLKKLSVMVDPTANLSGIGKLKKLEVLDFGAYTKLKNISFLKELTLLRELRLPIEGTVDIAIINSLPNLRKLHLYSGGHINFAPLGNNKTIEHIDLVHPTYIDDLTPFSKMANLKMFEAYLAENSKVTALKNMTSLEYFSFGLYFHITDFSFIDSLKNLKYFEAQLDYESLQKKYPQVKRVYYNKWLEGYGGYRIEND